MTPTTHQEPPNDPAIIEAKQNEASLNNSHNTTGTTRSIIVFNEKIEEFSYIDHEPISIEPHKEPDILGKDLTQHAVNLERVKLDTLDENNNTNAGETCDLSSSPETASSSEKSRVVVRKKTFFKSKKTKDKSHNLEKELESEPLPRRSEEAVDLFHVSSDVKLKSHNLSKTASEKNGFSFRKSFFKSKKVKANSSLDKLDDELDQLTNDEKKQSLLNTIMDENDEDSDGSCTNTDTTSTKQNSVHNENLTSATKRSTSKIKKIFSKKNSKADRNTPSSNNYTRDSSDDKVLEANFETRHVFRV